MGWLVAVVVIAVLFSAGKSAGSTLRPRTFRFVGAAGTFTWSRAELDDTIFEGEEWDGLQAQVDALDVGRSIFVGGESLTRIT